MRVLVDENIPRMTVEYFRELGHDVVDIRGTPDQGLGDHDLWSGAQASKLILITTDRGFTEFRAIAHAGILIVRLRQPNRLKIHQGVLGALRRFPEEEWPGLLVVVRDATLSVVSFRRGHKEALKRRLLDPRTDSRELVVIDYSISSVTVTGTDFGAKHMRSLQA